MLPGADYSSLRPPAPPALPRLAPRGAMGDTPEAPMVNRIKTLDRQMAVYAAYHRNPVNRLTHFAGVPLIMFSLLLALSWTSVSLAGVSITGAMILAALVLAYYFVLDTALAAAMAVFTGLLLAVAHWVAATFPPAVGWGTFAACFIGGPLVRRPPAGAGGQLVADLRGADFSDGGSVLRAGAQDRCQGAGPDPSGARHARFRLTAGAAATYCSERFRPTRVTVPGPARPCPGAAAAPRHWGGSRRPA